MVIFFFPLLCYVLLFFLSYGDVGGDNLDDDSDVPWSRYDNDEDDNGGEEDYFKRKLVNMKCPQHVCITCLPVCSMTDTLFRNKGLWEERMEGYTEGETERGYFDRERGQGMGEGGTVHTVAHMALVSGL